VLAAIALVVAGCSSSTATSASTAASATTTAVSAVTTTPSTATSVAPAGGATSSSGAPTSASPATTSTAATTTTSVPTSASRTTAATATTATATTATPTSAPPTTPPASVASTTGATTLPAGTTVPLTTQGGVIIVANASGIDGAAAVISSALAGLGFQTVKATNAAGYEDSLDVSKVYFTPDAYPVAYSVAQLMGGVVVAPMPTPPPIYLALDGLRGANVIVMLGKDLAGHPLPGVHSG
jgi:hypothetical protein